MSVLSTKAVLASLNVGGWDARMRDDRASNVVRKHFKAGEKSGNFNKALIDHDDPSWDRITKARTALRDYHYAHTVGWVHKGAQLLPAAMYLDYNSEIAKLIKEYHDAADAFVSKQYLRLKEKAKRDTRLGGLYRESDYPSPVELSRKFYADVSFLPVPDAGHVVVDLQNTEIARIKRDTERMIEEAVEQAQADVWDRLYKPVAAMAAALTDPDKRFHDTLISNVKEIAALAPKMNLTGDEKLTAMIAEVKKLTKPSPDALRTDEDKRAEYAAKAAALAKKMKSLMPVAP